MLSIIIPTFNRNELLEFGLSSIARQEVPFKYEIIILNEYIDDESRQIAEKYNAKYILTRPNLTVNEISWRCPGIAINHGVKQAQTEHIIIACPEMWHLHNTNLNNLITPLLSKRRIATHSTCLDDTGNILYALKNNLHPKCDNLRKLESQYPFFLAMHKKTFESVGGYDMDFQDGFAFDDTNFTQRMKNSGVQYVPVEGVIVHLFHPRLRYNMENVQRLWRRNKQLYEERIGDVVANKGREWGKL